MARLRRPVHLRSIVTALSAVTLAMLLTVSTAVGYTTDTYFGHLHHDASLTWFTGTQRHHTGGSIEVLPDNGPNNQSAMRMGLAWQVGGAWVQFTNSIAITCYNNCPQIFTDASSGSDHFSNRWFIIDARMVTACGIFCDDDFGGQITYSL
jgi:hypothetical protein